ncbi:NADP-dependent oxidoreductase [bacterium SCGC AG-212-C10]|nr:NADP-dependent oxidoreductase [bacterium SCGC AG-212-C10]
MKAAVYYKTGGPEVLQYEEIPDPQVRPSGVILDIKYVSIQGGDLLHRKGGVLATTPHVVGYQAAGIISEVGANVTERKVGDRVVATMGFGSHAEKVSVPWQTTYLVPDGLDLAQAAGVPIEFGTADDCLFEFGHLQAGETVLVQAGGGGVGLAAIQLAKAAGATVFATASSDARLEQLKQYGMDEGINYREKDFVAETMRLTGGKGVNLVVDSVGGKTLEGSVAALAYRGRVSWVGQAGREDYVPNLWPLMTKNASMTGVFLGAEFGVAPDRTRKMIESLVQRVASGELTSVIDRIFPLSEAAAAHTYIEGRSAVGRVLLQP